MEITVGGKRTTISIAVEKSVSFTSTSFKEVLVTRKNSSHLLNFWHGANGECWKISWVNCGKSSSFLLTLLAVGCECESLNGLLLTDFYWCIMITGLLLAWIQKSMNIHDIGWHWQLNILRLRFKIYSLIYNIYACFMIVTINGKG